MLLVPAACVGSNLGDGSDAASFDLSYAPDIARPPEVRASSLSQIALAATAQLSPRSPVAKEPSSASGAVSAGSALAKTSAEIEAVSALTSTTTTTVPVGARSETTETTAPSSARTGPPVALNLPLNLETALRNLSGDVEQGEASWFDAPDGTCAHQTLPFGTLVKVTSLLDGTTTTCEVDDRGPFIGGRVIDLSYDVFEKLAHPGSGVIDVVIEW